MNEKLFNQIAKKYQPAIKDIYHDEDGYWCVLSCEGEYILDGYDSEYTIHEDTMREVKQILRECLVKIERPTIEERSDDVSETIESKIKTKRLEMGLSRAELARRFNMPIRTLEDYESGKRKPAEWVEALILEKMDTWK